jgi:tRNA pseudouridine38-40 synthase
MKEEQPPRRLAVLLEYQGTGYSGSQYQKNAPTVQGALERALSSLTGEPIRVALAGRTDSGVHALGQVASFLTRSRHSAALFARGANALLPEDIAVRAVVEVPLSFDPRRHATGRWYRYMLYVGAQRPALLRQFSWHVAGELDEAAMQEAAKALPGRHDFAAFTAPSEAARRVTERVVTRAQLRRVRNLVLFDIEANAFLLHMVRRIVGALVQVGKGERTPAQFERLLRDPSPGEARLLAPARGLCLMKVRYESGLFDNETCKDI